MHQNQNQVQEKMSTHDLSSIDYQTSFATVHDVELPNKHIKKSITKKLKLLNPKFQNLVRQTFLCYKPNIFRRNLLVQPWAACVFLFLLRLGLKLSHATTYYPQPESTTAILGAQP